MNQKVGHSSMIPLFPQFKVVSVEDNEEVEKYTRHFPYYSDFNFTSLWSWDIDHRREVSILNNNLVVKFTDYASGEHFLSFLGIHMCNETTISLLDYSVSIGLPEVLKLVPEISVHNLAISNVKCTQDVDNFDYIYLTEKICELHGNQYKSKRKAVDKFEKGSFIKEYAVSSLSDLETQEKIRTISEHWRVNKGVSADDQSIIHEIDAIENVFKLASARDFFVGIVSIDGIAVAYTIEEIVNKILSIGHFWKTSSQTPGVYEFLARETATYLKGKEVVYWNWEQDLGIESLWASKSSFRPSDFLKKFIVTRT